MAHLFFGVLPGVGRSKKPKLYDRYRALVEEREFGKYTRLGKLTPKKGLSHVARLWHIPVFNATALSWMQDGNEQTVFMPGIQDRIKAIATAREVWDDLIPSSITFRVGESAWQLT